MRGYVGGLTWTKKKMVLGLLQIKKSFLKRRLMSSHRMTAKNLASEVVLLKKI